MYEIRNGFRLTHLLGKEAETQRDSVICPSSHSQYVAYFESRFLGSSLTLTGPGRREKAV